MATKLTVTTDIGTFTRTTVRTYSHIVVVKGYRLEHLEQWRLHEIRRLQQERAGYERILAGDQTEGIRTTSQTARDWDIQCRDKSLADGSYANWVIDLTSRLHDLTAQGPITQDGNHWNDYHPQAIGRGAPAAWFVLGWTGRPDLAEKLAAGKEAAHYRDVRVYAVDGTRVR